MIMKLNSIFAWTNELNNYLPEKIWTIMIIALLLFTLQKRVLYCTGLAIKRCAARSKTRLLFDMTEIRLKTFKVNIFEQEKNVFQLKFSKEIIF